MDFELAAIFSSGNVRQYQIASSGLDGRIKVVTVDPIAMLDASYASGVTDGVVVTILLLHVNFR